MRGPGSPSIGAAHPVGMQPGADHELAEAVHAARRGHLDGIDAARDRRHVARQHDATTRRGDVVAIGIGDGAEVGDRRRRRVQCGETGRVRLDVGDARPLDPGETRHAVGRGRDLQRVEPTDLRLVDGDDQLAALLVRQLALPAVIPQQLTAAGAQDGLEAAGLVVDAGVHDPGVVAGLVSAETVLLLEDVDGEPGIPTGELATDRQTEDATADDPHGKVAQ